MGEIFKDAYENLESLRQCIVCGTDESIIEIKSYYKLDYCPTHLELAKKERVEKKKEEFTAKDLFIKLDQIKAELLSAIQSGIPTSSTEISSSALSKKTMLRMLYKARDLIPRDFHSIFGKENAITVRNMLMEMAKVDEFTYQKSRRQIKGKLLWKNKKSHYMINPNLPKETFEQLTEITVDEGDYKIVMQELINKARAAKFQYEGWDGQTGKWVFLG